MSNIELNAKIYKLRELKRFAEEIAGDIETIQDEIKNHMNAAGLNQIAGNDWKVTYKEITGSRLDTAAIKRYYPDIAEKHTKQTVSKRFLLV